MSPLRPVKSTYTPKYPRRLTDAELRVYLRPGLARRFSNETVVLSTMLLGSTLASCSASSARKDGEDEPATPSAVVVDAALPGPATWVPGRRETTYTSQALGERVNQIVHEVLGQYPKGLWYDKSEVGHYRLIAGVPPVKYPSVNIMFGNSIAGLFNLEEARETTKKLFQAYGIALEPEVALEGEGYRFTADGFNRELGVGFEIRETMHGRTIAGEGQVSTLGEGELLGLEQDVSKGKLNLFVCNAETNYDNDHKMSMAYYLTSVVDYLDWLHGERTVACDLIVGEKKAMVRAQGYPREGMQDLWDVERSREKGVWMRLDENGAPQGGAVDVLSGIRLEPGKAAFYVLPAEATERIGDGLHAARVVVSFGIPDPERMPIDVDLILNDDPDTRCRQLILPGTDGVVTCRLEGELAKTHTLFHSLTIRNVNSFPIEIKPKRIGVAAY